MYVISRVSLSGDESKEESMWYAWVLCSTTRLWSGACDINGFFFQR